MFDRLWRHWGTIGFLLLLAWFWHINGLPALGAVLSAAMTHELGHIFVLYHQGASVDMFRLSPGGAVIRTTALQLSYTQELFAVLAGPLANLAAALLLTHLSEIYPCAAMFAGAHWVLGLFNLFPAAPLDGWRLLQLLFCWSLGPGTGGRLAAVLGIIFSGLLFCGIVYLIVMTGGNLWLLPTAIGIVSTGLREVISGR